MHQSNGYIKRSLRVWRAEKCIAFVGAETVLTSAGPQTTPFLGVQYRLEMEICEVSGLPIFPVLRLHQSNGYLKTKLRVWRIQKYIALVRGKAPPTCAGLQSTPFHGWQARAENGNMRNFGPSNPHGTTLAPKQWLYQKEATGMESSKMCCSWQSEVSHISIPDLILPPMKWGSLRTRPRKYSFCTNPHGTTFAPKQWLYQKKATGLEIS